MRAPRWRAKPWGRAGAPLFSYLCPRYLLCQATSPAIRTLSRIAANAPRASRSDVNMAVAAKGVSATLRWPGCSP